MKNKWLLNGTRRADHAIRRRRHRQQMFVIFATFRLVPHIFASIVATAGIHLIIVLRTRHHRAQHRTYWQMTRTPTPQLPISKVTRRSHHLPRSSVSRRHWIVTITEESGEKHKEPRGVSLQRNHRRNSLLMGGPSTDFACRTFPLILLACERTIGCTDALPV